MKINTTPLACLALTGTVALASGCLVMKGQETSESGVKVTQSTLTQIKPSETTEAWLVAALGEPTSKRDVDEQTHILRYDHIVTTEKGGTVFLLFAGGESRQEKSTTYFEVKNSVVTRYWTEG